MFPPDYISHYQKFLSENHEPVDLVYLGLVERVVGRLPSRGFIDENSISLGVFHAPWKVVTLGLISMLSQDGVEKSFAKQIEYASVFARENGANKIIAPLDGLTWFSYRTREGKEREYWEPGYSAGLSTRLLENGFTQNERARSVVYDFTECDEGEFQRCIEILSSGRNFDSTQYRISKLEVKSDIAELLKLKKIQDEVFAKTPLYVPLLDGEFVDFMRWVGSRLDCSPSLIARNNQDDIVGYILAFIHSGNLVLKTIGVSPSLRNTGLAKAMIAEMLVQTRARGMQSFSGALVREGNQSETLISYDVPKSLKAHYRSYVLWERVV